MILLVLQSLYNCGGDNVGAVTFKSLLFVLRRGICRGDGEGAFKDCGAAAPSFATLD